MTEFDKHIAEVDEMEELITDAIGWEDAFHAVSKYLSYDEKKEMYDFIIRTYELEVDYEED